MNLGALIKNYREAHGITLLELSKKLKTPYSNIQSWEAGRNNLKEEKALEILMIGFNIPYNEAKDIIAEFKIKEASEDLSEEARINIFGNNSVVFGSGNTINNAPIDKELIEMILKSKDKEDIKEIAKSGETKSLMKLLKSGKLDYLKKLLNID